MENSFLKNKIIIRYCPDYYRIINERFSSLDYMSDKVIKVYQTYIFSVEPRNRSELKRAISLNSAIVKYFDDRDFRIILSDSLKSLKVPKGATDVINRIVNMILDSYARYMEGYTRNLYIPKWI